jgi:hypothetical protein
MRSCRGGPHLRWIVLNAVLGAALVNLVLSAALFWLSVRGRASVPVWPSGSVFAPSVLGDTVGTSLVLPFTTCLLCTAAVRRELAGGRLSRLRLAGVWWVLRALPVDRLRRSVLCGVLTTVCAAPVIASILSGVDTETLAAETFGVLKVAYAVGLGALVTPLIAWRAMADPA